MKTIFLRHGKLDLPYASHDEMPFEVICDLGTGALDPEVDKGFARTRIQELTAQIDLSNIARIYASPSRRAQSTALLLSESIESLSGTRPQVLAEPLIAEVAFDLDKLGDKVHTIELVRQSGMSALNELVFQGMISGTCESAQAAYSRVARFMDLQDANALCISHDFLMRIAELWTRHAGDVPDITIEMLQSTERNGYLGGFALSEGQLTSISS